MRFSDYGLSLMSNGIVASDKIIAENPDLVRRFAAATVEAIGAAVATRSMASTSSCNMRRMRASAARSLPRQWNVAMGLLHTPTDEGQTVWDDG